MGVYSGNDVDTAGDAEVTLKTAAGAELLGQQVSAASLPVVIASNQSAVPISAASLPLPTGAATETTLSSINTKTPALGSTTMTGSTPVVIASDQNPGGPIYQFDVEKKRLYGLVTETNMATAVEVRLILIRNPAGSGKTLYLQRWTLLLTNTANSSGVIRAYLAPTILTTGTAASIVNTAVGGGGAATVMQAFINPTATVLGTFAYATRVQGGDGAQPTEVNFEGSISIAPGVDVIITGTPDGTNRNVISSFLWMEK